MKYVSIASGSRGNCFIIQTQSSTLMIDCGGTKAHLMRSFKELNLSTNDIDALLITHNHHDHIQQIKHFSHIKTYSPVELTTNHQILIKEDEAFSVNECTIIPIGLSHDSMITVGYIINDQKEKLVYITDTGYIKESVLPLIKDADYYIIESNHDPMMLMKLNRPHYLKARILSDNGHLCNQESAIVLSKVIGNNTKEVLLAHISEEANTIGLALYTVTNYLKEHARVPIIKAAKQFEIVMGGSI
jgi:phosphoribosyl 1,2-cyclic phosphodiesterase